MNTAMVKTLRVIFAAGALLLFIAVAAVAGSSQAAASPSRDWVFIYYMSYDNNLSRHGETVLGRLSAGLHGPGLVVAVQADLAGAEGMKRIVLRGEAGGATRSEIPVGSDESADTGEYGRYLAWVREKLPARNYAVVFLNHGGKLNSMCSDDGSGRWLNAMEVGKITADFNSSVDGRVRLLFFQQCGRGSLENLYNFTDAAEYILASPLNVGAPNTYYAPMLEAVAEYPAMSGADVAGVIIDEDEHFAVYTLLSNEQLRLLPEKLAPAVKSLLARGDIRLPEDMRQAFRYDDEMNYDVSSFFEGIRPPEGPAKSEVDAFLRWYEEELVMETSEGDLSRNWGAPYSGLSVYVPSDPDHLKRYSELPLYRKTGLDTLMDRLTRSSKRAER